MAAGETRKRRILMCGGHLHGHSVSVPEDQSAVYAVDPATVPALVQYLESGDDPRTTPPAVTSVTYKIKRLPVAVPGLGRIDVWVGIPEAIEDTPREGREVVRAFFRDEVAELLLGPS